MRFFAWSTCLVQAHTATFLSSDRSTAEDSAALRLELDLDSLRVDAAQAQGKAGFHLMSATVNGSEVACLNCQLELFTEWVQQLGHAAPRAGGKGGAGATKAHSAKTIGKHPNAPGYDEWAKASKLSLLDASESPPPARGHAWMNQSALNISHEHGWDISEHQARLHTLWANRRLIVGSGQEPGKRKMNFIEALVSLGREAPVLTPVDCDRSKVSHCDALLSGDKTASAAELRRALEQSFGKEFLEKHEYRSGMSEEEQRSHLQALLTAMKEKYAFYYHTCLVHQPGTESCDPKAQAAALLGRIPCRAEDDEVSDDCVYAEVLLCDSCGEEARFFEYSRFHGPLALFATAAERHGVMGQCEEFSRAGHALLSSLGYTTRYVLDFTDHVWVEVQVPKGSGKWVHADPSEGVFDSPLMYEKGWGKQLTMVFAFTPHRVEHVTASYTEDYAETVGRRGISEKDLAAALAEVNRRLTGELPLQSFGYSHHASSRDRTLDEIALWSHFEAP